MKKFQSLGKVLTKDQQFKIKGGCTPEEMCDPNDILSCGGMVTCNCPQVSGTFQCCLNAAQACAVNRGCSSANFACQ